MTGKLFNGIVNFDESFFVALAKMINEEPIQTRDLVALAQLRSIGIEKGKNFNPDIPTKMILKKVAAQAHTDLMSKSIGSLEPYWGETNQWGMIYKTAADTDFTFVTKDGVYDIDTRALVYYLGFAPPKKWGKATFYLAAYTDANGKPFTGDKTYRLHVPANAPAKQYWSVTVYDLATAAFIKDAPSLTIDSYNANVQKNADGSVDVYFGPKAPQGKESNWIYTAPGKPWFSFFRFYGPELALFEKKWKLSDVEELA